MKCLAVNTANTVLSLAIVDGRDILFRFDSAETRNQGNLLLSHAQQGMKEAGISFGGLDLLAVVTGPGSFTGIRIGIAALRGMALAAELPLIGISSFDLFAARKEGFENIVALESWRDELYFQRDGHEPVNETPEVFARSMGEGPFLISGDARGKLAPFLPGATLLAADPAAPEAAFLAMEKFQKGGAAEKPVPFYLRPPDVTFPKAKGA